MEDTKLPNILVTGTPGVGKTTLCSLLESSLHEEGKTGYKYIMLAERIREEKLYKDWNKEFDVSEYDEDMVCDNLEDEMSKGGVILEFHSCGFFPERWFQLIVLLRCDNTHLYDRLAERGYDQNKITENIECEIMEVTSEEVRESYKSDIILELANQEIDDVETNIEKIKEKLEQL
ncbi:unnamed protein product [Moneuplotes crassus]|uniref:Adenylate kinase isoenzyme 6 homolog n=1 Tax=Euplotes crassus TaxID=5936 RepID=A0AAD1Y2M4_EUPCR|nr:unnamed protein product [Moneuplotes crassus]